MTYGTIPAQQGEAERLKSLLAYDILDTPPDPAFDEIVRVAAQVTGAPYAYLGFLDANRLWFKSRVGFPEPELPRAATANVPTAPVALCRGAPRYERQWRLRARGRPVDGKRPSAAASEISSGSASRMVNWQAVAARGNSGSGKPTRDLNHSRFASRKPR